MVEIYKRGQENDREREKERERYLVHQSVWIIISPTVIWHIMTPVSGCIYIYVYTHTHINVHIESQNGLS